MCVPLFVFALGAARRRTQVQTRLEVHGCWCVGERSLEVLLDLAFGEDCVDVGERSPRFFGAGRPVEGRQRREGGAGVVAGPGCIGEITQDGTPAGDAPVAGGIAWIEDPERVLEGLRGAPGSERK